MVVKGVFVGAIQPLTFSRPRTTSSLVQHPALSLSRSPWRPHQVWTLVMASSLSAASSQKDPPQASCNAIVPYVPSNFHGLHARSVNYKFPSLDVEVDLTQRFGEEGVGLGGAAWPAGYALADYLSRRPAIPTYVPGAFDWSGKRVVELGAGLGIVSIVAALLGAKVVATDGAEGVIPILEENINRHTSGVAHPVQMRLLSWGNIEQEEPIRKKGVEVLLAADVVYGDKVHVWRKLLKSMNRLTTPDTLILFAHFSRYPEREKEFFKLLESRYECFPVDVAQVVKEHGRTTLYVLRKREQRADDIQLPP